MPEKGQKCSEETRARMRAARQARAPYDDEARAKMSAAKMGVPKSEEHRKAISRGKIGMKRSPEACKAISDGLRRYFAAKRELKEITRWRHPSAPEHK